MPRDVATTKARLLAAARDEFAEHGIDGARVDRIARQAGVSKERIYGHFGSKERLFEAVLAEVMDEHTALLGSPSGDIGDYVAALYDMHQENPQLLRLLLWEALHYGSRELPDEAGRVEHYARKRQQLERTLGTGSAESAFALLVLTGLAAWPLAVPQLTRTMVDPEYAGEVQPRDLLATFARRAFGPPAPLADGPAPA